MVVILFSLGCAMMLYLAARRMTDRLDIPLIAAFCMAVMPVCVFFGRNIQPDFAALFFTLLATWIFLKWTDELKPYQLLLSVLFWAMTAAIKGSFLITAIPLAALFPWSRAREADYRRRVSGQLAYLLPGFIVVAAWVIFTSTVQSGGGRFFPYERLFLAESFTLDYWRSGLVLVWKYVGENFTRILFFIFLLGLMGSLIDLRSQVSRYIAISFLSAILYFVLISDFAIRHSYYQLPFVPMVCLGIAAAVSDGMLILKKRGEKWAKLRFLLPALILVGSIPFLKSEIDKHFDKQMIGCDVAGRYIEEHSGADERIFISFGSPSDRRFDAWRTQYYGILWEANRRGAMLPGDLSRLKFGEEERNFKWIVMFRFDWLDKDAALKEYIYDNYSIHQIGYMIPEDAGGDILLYYILAKGGGFDPNELEAVEKNRAREYRFSDRVIELWTKERGG
jgi:hypothetical protein